MTLVIAACGIDYVILASDSRGTIKQGPARVEINHYKKMVPIGRHVAILIYGNAPHATYLVERFESKRVRTNAGVSEVAEEFATFCRKQARQLVNVPVPTALNFGFVIGGLDKKGKSFVPHAYSLTNMDGYCLGSHQGYVLKGKPVLGYYLFRTYYNKELTAEQMRKLAAVTLNETRRIDGDVGGEINIATVDIDGLRSVAPVDVTTYLVQWEQDSEENRLVRNKESSDGILADDER